MTFHSFDRCIGCWFMDGVKVERPQRMRGRTTLRPDGTNKELSTEKNQPIGGSFVIGKALCDHGCPALSRCTDRCGPAT